ncbi:MAG: hypothetical protein IJ400_04850 [Clostridia bacterium]|nr:hypothetical protein [Clostridia bacterium]
MDISNDKEAYLLSKIIGEVDSEKSGTEFLQKYWITSGRLKYTQKLLGEAFSFDEDEIQYLINVEILCDRLVSTLRSFLREPYCRVRRNDVEIDSSVKQASAELIVEFENLQSICLNHDWKGLVENFSRTVFQIEAIISRLMAMHSTGKQVCFYTNVSAEAFLNASQIDLHNENDKYFIPKK